ncbi:uncharacterized protein B0I36DRAFT_335055, partial [Microdochium trichocladiopsis]
MNYTRMVEDILRHKTSTQDYCLKVLSSMTIAYRPLHLEELPNISGLPLRYFQKREAVLALIRHCQSFPVVRVTISTLFISQAGRGD